MKLNKFCSTREVNHMNRSECAQQLHDCLLFSFMWVTWHSIIYLFSFHSSFSFLTHIISITPLFAWWFCSAETCRTFEHSYWLFWALVSRFWRHMTNTLPFESSIRQCELWHSFRTFSCSRVNKLWTPLGMHDCKLVAGNNCTFSRESGFAFRTVLSQ